MRSQSTIFALSSGSPPAAIAVMRVSGPDALAAGQALTGRDLPVARRAALRHFLDPATGEVIDEGLLLAFPGPRTETGEDMIELHCHGSHAVVRRLEGLLAQLPGLRLARPGEFTRRAFLNGKMDLAGIEGLGDLLRAETEMQRRAAMAMFGGALSRRIDVWVGELRRLAAGIEAQLDFSDEGDVAAVAENMSRLVAACELIALAMETEQAKPPADRLKEGVRIAIGGPPNAGKSSLFNMLIGRDAAIVSSIAGTTRDVIEASVAIAGIPMLIADSAGLRESGDEVERIGIARAEALLLRADILLWLGLPEDRPDVAGHVIQLSPKCDLAAPDGKGLAISVKTGEGVDALISRLCDVAGTLLPMPGDYVLSTRQRTALSRAATEVREAASLYDEVLVGECLRLALGALDELTGRATTDAVLDELFSGFCIGK